MITLDDIAEALHSDVEPFYFYDEQEGEVPNGKPSSFVAEVCCLTVTVEDTNLGGQVSRHYEEGPFGYTESGSAEFIQRNQVFAEFELSGIQLDHAQMHGFEPIGLLGLQALSEAFTCQYYGACGEECNEVLDPEVWTAQLISFWGKIASETCECGQHARSEIQKLRELAEENKEEL